MCAHAKEVEKVNAKKVSWVDGGTVVLRRVRCEKCSAAFSAGRALNVEGAGSGSKFGRIRLPVSRPPVLRE